MDKLDHFTRESLPIKVVRMGHHGPTALHCHDFYELVIVFDGEGIHRTETDEYRIRAGDTFLIKPGYGHEYFDTHDLSLVNILYQPERLNLPLYDLADAAGYHAFFELEPALRKRHGFRSVLHVSSETLEYLRGMTAMLEKVLEARQKGCLFAAAACMMQIMSCISHSFSQPSAPAQLDLFRLSETMSYIERHWQEEISLRELANKASMSPSTFYRMFMKTVGKSPVNYLIDLRLNKAAEMLVHSTVQVSAIASLTGFPDSNYFSRLFKRHSGITPRQYRAKFS